LFGTKETFFLDTDFTDGHGLGLFCLNNGIIVQTMLPFHKCCRIYEIKGSVICEIRVKGFIKLVRRALGSHMAGSRD